MQRTISAMVGKGSVNHNSQMCIRDSRQYNMDYQNNTKTTLHGL